jgi:ATP-dependent helicase HrpB
LEVEQLSTKDSKILGDACRLAVLINEEKAGSEDLMEELSKFRPGYESKRLEEQLEGLLHGDKAAKKTSHLDSTLLAKALLTAFPDRVGRVRVSEGSEARNKSGRVRELLLSTGGTVLANDSALTREHEYFVVVEAQETSFGGKTQVKVRSMCPIEVGWLLDFFPDELAEEQTFQWNAKAGRVEGFQRLKYGQLVLEEKPLSPGDFGPEAQALLLKEALSAGTQAYCDPEELESFRNRVKFAGERSKAFGEFSEGMIQETLKELAQGCRSLEDLKSAGLIQALRLKLEPKDQALLERLAPGSILLPTGRRITIHYDPGKPPWAESRLQDFLGMSKGPAVGGGEVPVVLHLLSPGKKRAVQITSDLEGFWRNHYPQVRRELMRKYPRHKWPENPV